MIGFKSNKVILPVEQMLSIFINMIYNLKMVRFDLNRFLIL